MEETLRGDLETSRERDRERELKYLYSYPTRSNRGSRLDSLNGNCTTVERGDPANPFYTKPTIRTHTLHIAAKACIAIPPFQSPSPTRAPIISLRVRSRGGRLIRDTATFRSLLQHSLTFVLPMSNMRKPECTGSRNLEPRRLLARWVRRRERDTGGLRPEMCNL